MRLKVTPEIARIHAHICGDGFIYISREKRSSADLLSHPRKNIFRNQWILAYSNTCRKLINEFMNDLKIAFNRKGQYREKYSEVRISGAKSIIKKLYLRFKSSYNWFIPKYIFNSSEIIITNWIRAFFDDEAYVNDSRNVIIVNSVNKKGLYELSKLLIRLKILSKIYGPYTNSNSINKFWRLQIKDIIRYNKKIGFLHPEKKSKLEKIINGTSVNITTVN